MAASSGIYVADDIVRPIKGAPNSSYIRRRFTATVATMLAQTGATKFLLGDVILLAPLPERAVLTDWRIYVPALDTSTGSTWSVGDTQVLTGAVTGKVSGAQTTPAVGTAFTLTAAASTAGFTATNGILIVGNNSIVNYESLSGSTFVNCRTNNAGIIYPDGAAIQQAGNHAAYASAVVAGRSSAAAIITNDFVIIGTGVVTATIVLNGVPAVLPGAYNTAVQNPIGVIGTLGNIAPLFFTMRATAAITTVVTTGVITGWVGYYQQGY